MPVSMTMPQYRRWECSFAGRTIRLNKQETELLALLLLSYPRPLTREQMVEHMWPDPDDEPDSSWNLVAQLISRLRGKIHKDVLPNRYMLGYILAQTPEAMVAPRRSANGARCIRAKPRNVHRWCEYCGSRLVVPA